MDRKALVFFLKALTIVVAVIALVVLGILIPEVIFSFGAEDAYAKLTVPAVVTDVVCLIFVFIALCYLWQICTDIGRDRSFCADNATRLVKIGVCAIIDTFVSTVMAIIMLAVGALHPAVALAAMMVIVFGLLIATGAFMLSYLIRRAAKLEDDAKYTV